MQLQRTVLTPAEPEKVFAYLSDFTTTTEWDPGTVRTERVSGDGGVGTTYRNTSRFLGRETELTYTVEEHAAPTTVALRGENATVLAHDRMEMRAAGAGTEVTYTATFEFKGAARFLAPLLRPALTKLGNDAEQGLSDALGRLAKRP
jgi:carbon monoxide dehydrogenase subunit G